MVGLRHYGIPSGQLADRHGLIKFHPRVEITRNKLQRDCSTA
jgi:hypothetical protein